MNIITPEARPPIRIECPSCQQHIEIEQPEPAVPAQAAELHRQGNTASSAGKLLLIVSLIATFLVFSVDPDLRPSAIIIAAGSFLFGLFLVVIAQLIHIRANTEK